MASLGTILRKGSVMLEVQEFWRPPGYVEYWDEVTVAAALALYDKDLMVRIHSLGQVEDRAVALLEIRHDLPWIEGHFVNNPVVRLIEFGEIAAQAVLLLALAEERMHRIMRVGYRDARATFIEWNPKKQEAVRPGDTVAVLLGWGEAEYGVYAKPELRSYRFIDFGVPIAINSIRKPRIATRGEAWVLGRPTTRFEIECEPGQNLLTESKGELALA